MLTAVLLAVFIQGPDRKRFHSPGFSKMNDKTQGVLLQFPGYLQFGPRIVYLLHCCCYGSRQLSANLA